MTARRARRAALAGIAAAGALALARGLLVHVTVRGDSMSPWVRDGDRVIAVRRLGLLPLRRGMVVCGPLRAALERTAMGGLPDAGAMYVKRLVAGPGDRLPGDAPAGPAGDTAPLEDQRVPPGLWFLQGDNPSSGDSRHWGLVPDGAVTAVAVARLRVAGRTAPP